MNNFDIVFYNKNIPNRYDLLYLICYFCNPKLKYNYEKNLHICSYANACLFCFWASRTY